MAGKIIINSERCKGCGLCVVVCSNGVIEISEQSNTYGYYPAQGNGKKCTGCTKCAIICPDACIKVLVDTRIIAIESGSGQKKQLIKEQL